MVELRDLKLNDPSPAGPLHVEPATRPSLLVPGLFLAALIGFGITALVWPRHPATPTPPAAAAPRPAPIQPPPSRIAAEPGDAIDLPPLDGSDDLVRQLVSRLSSHPRAAAWLATDGLIRNFAVVLSNVGEGSTPEAALARQRPSQSFTVAQTPSGTIIDPASFHRYDGYADAVAGLDARGTARLYATLKPRIQEAYRELGDPSGDPDAALTRAIIVLLRTPVAGETIPLTRTSVLWQYADPSLESLPAASRQLLRMGPRNQRLIQDKLRELAPYLGIDPATLPAR